MSPKDLLDFDKMAEVERENKLYARPVTMQEIDNQVALSQLGEVDMGRGFLPEDEYNQI